MSTRSRDNARLNQGRYYSLSQGTTGGQFRNRINITLIKVTILLYIYIYSSYDTMNRKIIKIYLQSISDRHVS